MDTVGDLQGDLGAVFGHIRHDLEHRDLLVFGEAVRDEVQAGVDPDVPGHEWRQCFQDLPGHATFVDCSLQGFLAHLYHDPTRMSYFQ